MNGAVYAWFNSTENRWFSCVEGEKPLFTFEFLPDAEAFRTKIEALERARDRATPDQWEIMIYDPEDDIEE